MADLLVVAPDTTGARRLQERVAPLPAQATTLATMASAPQGVTLVVVAGGIGAVTEVRARYRVAAVLAVCSAGADMDRHALLEAGADVACSDEPRELRATVA